MSEPELVRLPSSHCCPRVSSLSERAGDTCVPPHGVGLSSSPGWLVTRSPGLCLPYVCWHLEFCPLGSP